MSRVEQTCLDFANPRKFSGPGHTHVGNLAAEIYYKEGLNKYIDAVPYDERCRNCQGSGTVSVPDPSGYDGGGWGGPSETCSKCHGKGKVQDIYKLRNAEFTWLSNKIEAFVAHTCNIKPEYSGEYYYIPKKKK